MTNVYCIDKKLYNILNKYFKQINDNIYCIYNNKLEKCRIDLRTKDYIITKNGKEISQYVILKIGAKRFVLHVNDSNFINYEKEGKYCFLAIHICNDSIYGFEVNEEKYYNLEGIQEYILNNIDPEIAENFKNKKKQDVYTYLLKDNGKCTLELIINNFNKEAEITYNLVKSNKYFKEYLDMTKLKIIGKINDNEEN